ncbi:MAG: tetratricopeptide repeat protein [Parvularculaceae bacterium]
MTNDETAFREVDQAVAEAEQLQFFRKYGAALIGAAAAFVVGVGGYQFWNGQKDAAASKAAAEFQTASETLQKAPEDGALALEAFSQEAPKGYALMADLKRASSLAGTGKREEALAVYRGIYGAADTPKRLRELARLRAATLSAADGRDAVLSDLGELVAETSALGFYARELQGVAALDARDFESALSVFNKMASDEAAPEPLRERAKEFASLASAGKAGVKLTAEAKIEDLVKALDEATVAAQTPPADDGHDHSEDAPAKDQQ